LSSELDQRKNDLRKYVVYYGKGVQNPEIFSQTLLK
jgi:hypothetical protein